MQTREIQLLEAILIELAHIAKGQEEIIRLLRSPPANQPPTHGGKIEVSK